ncbi:hypothetical protein AFB00_16810 [Pseudonocardia sp. HH130630-07]|nr:hypothetical protein AFB00_16810 [Pseudonocardia sp. HH130630-07]
MVMTGAAPAGITAEVVGGHVVLRGAREPERERAFLHRLPAPLGRRFVLLARDAARNADPDALRAALHDAVLDAARATPTPGEVWLGVEGLAQHPDLLAELAGDSGLTVLGPVGRLTFAAGSAIVVSDADGRPGWRRSSAGAPPRAHGWRFPPRPWESTVPDLSTSPLVSTPVMAGVAVRATGATPVGSGDLAFHVVGGRRAARIVVDDPPPSPESVATALSRFLGTAPTVVTLSSEAAAPSWLGRLCAAVGGPVLIAPCASLIAADGQVRDVVLDGGRELFDPFPTVLRLEPDGTQDVAVAAPPPAGWRSAGPAEYAPGDGGEHDGIRVHVVPSGLVVGRGPAPAPETGRRFDPTGWTIELGSPEDPPDDAVRIVAQHLVTGLDPGRRAMMRVVDHTPVAPAPAPADPAPADPEDAGAVSGARSRGAPEGRAARATRLGLRGGRPDARPGSPGGPPAETRRTRGAADDPRERIPEPPSTASGGEERPTPPRLVAGQRPRGTRRTHAAPHGQAPSPRPRSTDRDDRPPVRHAPAPGPEERPGPSRPAPAERPSVRDDRPAPRPAGPDGRPRGQPAALGERSAPASESRGEDPIPKSRVDDPRPVPRVDGQAPMAGVNAAPARRAPVSRTASAGPPVERAAAPRAGTADPVRRAPAPRADTADARAAEDRADTAAPDERVLAPPPDIATPDTHAPRRRADTGAPAPTPRVRPAAPERRSPTPSPGPPVADGTSRPPVSDAAPDREPPAERASGGPAPEAVQPVPRWPPALPVLPNPVSTGSSVPAPVVEGAPIVLDDPADKPVHEEPAAAPEPSAPPGEERVPENALQVADRASTAAERSRFVAAAGDEFTEALAAVNTAMATWPALRGGAGHESDSDAKADFAAVYLYLDGREVSGAADIDAAIRRGHEGGVGGQLPCLVAGLRRLPVHRRPVLRQGIDDVAAEQGVTGRLLGEPAFISASTELDVTVPGARYDVLIMPASARRTGELVGGGPVAEVVFPAGSRYRTLGLHEADPAAEESGFPRVALLLRELAPDETASTAGELDARDRAALSRLERAVAGRRRATARIVEDPVAVARLTRRLSVVSPGEAPVPALSPAEAPVPVVSGARTGTSS